MRRLIAVALLALPAACLNAHAPLSPTASLGAPFELKYGTSAVLPGGLVLRFEAVKSESRCPIDAICVWAGEAIITVEARRPKRATHPADLRTTPAGRSVEVEGYVIELVELQPYPRSDKPRNDRDYVATLKVTSR